MHSANMKQIDSRTTMQKCDFKKAALQPLLKSHQRTVLPQTFQAHQQNTLLQENTSGGLLLNVKRVLKDLNYKSYYLQLLKEIYLHTK